MLAEVRYSCFEPGSMNLSLESLLISNPSSLFFFTFFLTNRKCGSAFTSKHTFFFSVCLQERIKVFSLGGGILCTLVFIVHLSCLRRTCTGLSISFIYMIETYYCNIHIHTLSLLGFNVILNSTKVFRYFLK